MHKDLMIRKKHPVSPSKACPRSSPTGSTFDLVSHSSKSKETLRTEATLIGLDPRNKIKKSKELLEERRSKVRVTWVIIGAFCFFAILISVGLFLWIFVFRPKAQGTDMANEEEKARRSGGLKIELPSKYRYHKDMMTSCIKLALAQNSKCQSCVYMKPWVHINCQEAVQCFLIMYKVDPDAKWEGIAREDVLLGGPIPPKEGHACARGKVCKKSSSDAKKLECVDDSKSDNVVKEEPKNPQWKTDKCKKVDECLSVWPTLKNFTKPLKTASYDCDLKEGMQNNHDFCSGPARAVVVQALNRQCDWDQANGGLPCDGLPITFELCKKCEEGTKVEDKLYMPPKPKTGGFGSYATRRNLNLRWNQCVNQQNLLDDKDENCLFKCKDKKEIEVMPNGYVCEKKDGDFNDMYCYFGKCVHVPEIITKRRKC